LPAQSARGGIIPPQKIRRRNRISSILGNFADFARGIPYIKKYDRLGDSTITIIGLRYLVY
jgi:hypothetical protein